MLGKKLAILLALAAPKRVSEIARLDRRFMLKRNNSVKFTLPGLSKTQTDGQNRSVQYNKFQKKKLCVVSCLLEYEKRTSHMRPDYLSEPDPLLRTIKKPHRGISPQTVSNWIKWIMKESGVDVSSFQAHSCRMVSTSKAAQNGLSLEHILSMADWSNANTFR